MTASLENGTGLTQAPADSGRPSAAYLHRAPGRVHGLTRRVIGRNVPPELPRGYFFARRGTSQWRRLPEALRDRIQDVTRANRVWADAEVDGAATFGFGIQERR